MNKDVKDVLFSLIVIIISDIKKENYSLHLNGEKKLFTHFCDYVKLVYINFR
jgi:hypothetical protein